MAKTGDRDLAVDTGLVPAMNPMGGTSPWMPVEVSRSTDLGVDCDDARLRPS
jgi:hypothetical protein